MKSKYNPCTLVEHNTKTGARPIKLRHGKARAQLAKEYVTMRERSRCLGHCAEEVVRTWDTEQFWSCTIYGKQRSTSRTKKRQKTKHKADYKTKIKEVLKIPRKHSQERRIKV